MRSHRQAELRIVRQIRMLNVLETFFELVVMTRRAHCAVKTRLRGPSRALVLLHVPSSMETFSSHFSSLVRISLDELRGNIPVPKSILCRIQTCFLCLLVTHHIRTYVHTVLRGLLTIWYEYCI